MDRLELILELGILKTMLERLLHLVAASGDQRLKAQVAKMMQEIMAKRQAAPAPRPLGR